MLQTGEIFDGYHILRKVGAGGFGEIWVCESVALGDLRALKFVPAAQLGRLDKEFQALRLYRNAAGRLRSPALMPIEHANLREDGLFYIMPLADGIDDALPVSPEWQPKTLLAVIERQKMEASWFSSRQIKGWMRPILQSLQLLSDASLVHRDVKPDNILFLSDAPCLSDISLLGEDGHRITRRGTPGYAAPSWYVESGGQPDMYGAAATLFTLMTGNAPDKMGRAAFRWPPQGEGSLSAEEKAAWNEMHRVIRIAVDERPQERFRDFMLFEEALLGALSRKKSDSGSFESFIKYSISRSLHKLRTNGAWAVLLASVAGFGLLLTVGATVYFGHKKVLTTAAAAQNHENQHAAERRFKDELAQLRKQLLIPRESFAAQMREIALDLAAFDSEDPAFTETPKRSLSEIKQRFFDTLKALPPKPDTQLRTNTMENLRERAVQLGMQYGPELRRDLESQIDRFDSDLNTDAEFRKEQGLSVLKRATALVNSHPESWDIIRPAQRFWFSGTVD